MASLKDARKKVEKRIYDVFNIIDTTGQNTEYYKNKFAKMSDKQFFDFFNQDFPIKFQIKIFEIDPKIEQILDAMNKINVPVLEEVNMPFLYRNKDGIPVKSQPVLVVYNLTKRLKQMVQKKTGYSVNISKRDMRTGLLIDTDKNGNSTDREMESLVVQGLTDTMRELSTYRADAMDAKSRFYAEINALGMVSQKDVHVDNDDSIARNMLSVYLIGCHLSNNLVNIEDITPRTIKRRNAGQSGVVRK